MKPYTLYPQTRITIVDVILLAMPLTALLVYFVTGPIMTNWENRRAAEAESQAKLLSLDAIQYAQDHNGHLPSAEHWEEELQAYERLPVDSFDRERVRTEAPYWEKPRRFAFNRALSGRDVNHIADPDRTVLFYESSLTNKDASDDLQALPAMDTTGIAVAYEAGWTEYETPERVASVMTASHHAEAALH